MVVDVILRLYNSLVLVMTIFFKSQTAAALCRQTSSLPCSPNYFKKSVFCSYPINCIIIIYFHILNVGVTKTLRNQWRNHEASLRSYVHVFFCGTMINCYTPTTNDTTFKHSESAYRRHSIAHPFFTIISVIRHIFMSVDLTIHYKQCLK